MQLQPTPCAGREVLAAYVNLKLLRGHDDTDQDLARDRTAHRSYSSARCAFDPATTDTATAGHLDVAALLMVEMGQLPQEQLRVICLDTKNNTQTIHSLARQRQ